MSKAEAAPSTAPINEDYETSVDIIDNFDDMGLKEDILRGIYSYGFEKPSAIQQRAIVPLARGKYFLRLYTNNASVRVITLTNVNIITILFVSNLRILRN